MTYYIKNGNSFTVTKESSLDIHNELPPECFIVQYDQQRGSYFLEQVDSFSTPKRVYGNILSRVERIFNTFLNRANSTGVMLNGEKGSGKTMLAKLLSLRGKAEGMPTIIINHPWHGDLFNKFMQDISQPSIVLFDEFEKVYDKDEQAAVLTLFDGVFQSRKLFILTCNDKYRIDQHMRNRPGRIFYMIDFAGIEKEAIQEYCEAELNDKEMIKQILLLASTFPDFNFDMLQALVEDMNRYKEDPFKTLEILNAKPFDDHTEYSVSVVINGEKIEGATGKGCLYTSQCNGNPINRRKPFYIHYEIGSEGEAGHVEEQFFLTNDDLVSLDSERIVYDVQDHPGVVVIFSKIVAENFTFEKYKHCF